MKANKTQDTASGARVAKQQRSRETQENILTAALAVFAEHGYGGTSTHMIAERAGIGQPLVVYHFPTKDALWLGTAEWTLGRFLEHMRPNFEALEGLDPAVRLSLIFQAFVRFSAKTPELLSLMIDANRRGGPNLDKMIEDQLRPTYERIRELIEAAQGSGAMTPGDPGLLYYSMIAVGAMLFTVNREFEQLTGLDPLEPDMVEAQANLLVRLFFPGL